jgi:hypothetical protein
MTGARLATYVSAIALILAPGAAAAQVSVEASPLRVEVQAWPGSSNTQAVTLTNVAGQRVRVRVSLSDWHLSRDGAPQFEEPLAARAYAATAWVRFAPPELTIEANAQAAVRFTVTVPRDAAPAGYRTGLLFDFTPEEKNGTVRSKEVTVRSRIATLVYVHVAARADGAAPAAGAHPPASVELTDLRVRPAVEETQVVATLKNTSRRSVRTRGTMVVYDRNGSTVLEMPVPDVPVLPESERDVVVPLLAAAERGRTLARGDYRLELKIDVGQPAVIVGETVLKIER